MCRAVQTRSVSTEGCNGPIPSFVEAVQKRIEALPDIDKVRQAHMLLSWQQVTALHAGSLGLPQER